MAKKEKLQTLAEQWGSLSLLEKICKKFDYK